MLTRVAALALIVALPVLTWAAEVPCADVLAAHASGHLMKRFEYHIEKTSSTDPNLNVLGREGWELILVVAAMLGGNSSTWYYYFKRELPSTP